MQPDLEKQMLALRADIEKMKRNPSLETHSHTGFDMDKVLFSNLSGRIEHYCHTLIGTTAATAANYTVFFIAPAPCYVSSFKEVHQTAGTDAGAVTLQLEKLNSTEALDAGDNVLATALSLKSAIDTVQTATLTTTNANRTLATGDRLAMKDAGTLTAVANVTVLLELTYT